MIICIAETRINELIGLKILLLSLQRYCPQTELYLYLPSDCPDFFSWMEKQSIQFRSISKELPEKVGWDVKAFILHDLLTSGHKEVWWIDSDVIITENFKMKYSSISEKAIILCEESLYGNYQDSGLRTKAWDLPLGRSLPFCLNSAVIRVTSHHLPLIARWCLLLKSKAYLEAKQLRWDLRPLHLLGDQDVLTALLGSDEFKKIPLKILLRGNDIIQYFGFSAYTSSERFNNLRKGMPPFIHCQGWKPWLLFNKKPIPDGLKNWLQRLYLELSPYQKMALSYKNQLGEDAPWLNIKSFWGKFFKILGCSSPQLTGLPLAILFDLIRFIKCITRKLR